MLRHKAIKRQMRKSKLLQDGVTHKAKPSPYSTHISLNFLEFPAVLCRKKTAPIIRLYVAADDKNQLVGLNDVIFVTSFQHTNYQTEQSPYASVMLVLIGLRTEFSLINDKRSTPLAFLHRVNSC